MTKKPKFKRGQIVKKRLNKNLSDVFCKVTGYDSGLDGYELDGLKGYIWDKRYLRALTKREAGRS